MLPTVDEVRAGLRVVRVPMRVPFRGVSVREAVLLEGPAGWGEFAPFPEYDDVESARWLAAAVEAAWTGWPRPRRTSVPVNATVPAVPAAAVPGVLDRFPGCTTVKVKVAQAGQVLADDVARVAAVRDVLGPAGRIRVDANAGWSVPVAVDALTALLPYGLEYAEQPCATLPELAALRRKLGGAVAIAADESVRKASDPARVAVAGAADLVVLKVAPMGGVAAALRVAAGCGLPVVVSSALDTSVGIAAGLALAAALPALPYACGLGTVGLMAADVVAEPLVPRAGMLPVGAVVPDPALLAELAAPPDVHAWWESRLLRCLDLLRANAAGVGADRADRGGADRADGAGGAGAAGAPA